MSLFQKQKYIKNGQQLHCKNDNIQLQKNKASKSYQATFTPYLLLHHIATTLKTIPHSLLNHIRYNQL